MSRWAFYSFLIWWLAITVLTLVFWLKPEGFFSSQKNSQLHKNQLVKYSFWASICAVLFFVTSFCFGIWLSLIRAKGWR